MSLAYNNYLDEHIANVQKAYWWLKEYLPEVVEYISDDEERVILKCHDESKYDPEEYDAYDDYFYGKNRTVEVEKAFNYAWLHHIHANPHHWQHWVLVNDDAEEGTVALDMPYYCIIEMICDWWTFSWRTGNLYEIFDWHKKHEKRIVFSHKTKKTVEDILDGIKNKLDEMKQEGDDE